MDLQDAGSGAGDAPYPAADLGRGPHVDELLQARPGDLEGRVQDEHRHHHGAQMIEKRPGRQQDGAGHGQDHRNGAEGVRTVVIGGGDHRHALDPAPDPQGPAVKDFFADDGGQGRRRGDPARRRQVLLVQGRYRLPADPDRRTHERQTDAHRHQGFHTSVSERMGVVRRTGPEPRSGVYQDDGEHIQQRFDAVGDHRLAVAVDAGAHFEDRQHDVDRDPDPGDLPDEPLRQGMGRRRRDIVEQQVVRHQVSR